MKLPKIRFKGFEGDWEEKKIDNICNRFDNLRIPISAKNRISGSIPYYWANGIQDYVDWYTHNWEFLLIAEDWANDLKNYPIQYVKWKIWVNNHAHVLQWKQELSNNIFLKYAIKHTNIESLLVWWWRAKLNASVLMWISISLPSLPEQEKIWSLFELLDSHISKNRQKLEKLKNMKQSFLQKLFPKDWSALPELRFKGFEGAWEERKLGELAMITTWKLDANAMNEDWIYDFYTSWIQKYKINTPAFKWPAITIAWNGATVWYMHLADWLFNAYQRTYVLTQFKIKRTFLYYEMRKKLPQKIQQEVRAWSIPYIVINMLTQLELGTPSLPEQEKIWAFFEKLDTQITQQSQKIQKLQNLKQSLLEKMFI